MYVRDLIASLLRRWYLLVIGLVATAALCFTAFTFVPASYETTAKMLLLPPESSLTGRGSNPYLYLGGLGQAVEVLSTRLNATEVMQPITDRYPDATITVAQDAESTGPILGITVSSPSAATTGNVVNELVTDVAPTLQTMQDQLEVTQNSRINVLALTPQLSVTEVTKGRDRAVILIAGVGVAGTILLVGLIDGLLLGRLPRLRRALQPAPGWNRAGEKNPPADDEAEVPDQAEHPAETPQRTLEPQAQAQHQARDETYGPEDHPYPSDDHAYPSDDHAYAAGDESRLVETGADADERS